MTSDGSIRLVERQDGFVPTKASANGATSLSRADELAALRAGLISNRRISLAMGILMRDQDIDEDEAFAALRRMSQDGNRKLIAVAEDVIDNRRNPLRKGRAERLTS